MTNQPKRFDLVAYLEEDLENRKIGGESCPGCLGQGWLRRQKLVRPVCPDCEGTGKSPAIAEAEAALATLRGEMERERKIRNWAVEYGDLFVWRDVCGEYQGSAQGAVLAILDGPKPVSNSAESGVSNEESGG